MFVSIFLNGFCHMGNNSNTTFIPQTPYIECQKFVLFCVFLCCLCFTGVRICKNWSSLSDTSVGRFDNRTGVTDQCCALSASNFYLKGAQNNTPLVFMSHKAQKSQKINVRKEVRSLNCFMSLHAQCHIFKQAHLGRWSDFLFFTLKQWLQR